MLSSFPLVAPIILFRLFTKMGACEHVQGSLKVHASGDSSAIRTLVTALHLEGPLHRGISWKPCWGFSSCHELLQAVNLPS